MGLSSRKKKNYDLNEVSIESLYQPIYDYTSLEIEEIDKGELILLEKDLSFQGKRLGEIAYKIGESLEKAKGIFKKYSAGEGDPESFVGWYNTLGLNKDQVYLFRGRYNLCLEHSQHQERILSLSDVAVKETINTKTPLEIRELVFRGELKTGSAIKKARAEIVENQSSRALESSRDDVLEAEIVETEEDVNIRLDKELEFIDRDIRERERNLKKLYSKREEILKIRSKGK